MKAYMFRASLYCEECGRSIRHAIDMGGNRPEDPSDETTYDSNDYPKGPYPDGGGEADSPQHCDACGVFLENDLTDDGKDYVLETIAEDLDHGLLDSVAVATWGPFYGVRIVIDRGDGAA